MERTGVISINQNQNQKRKRKKGIDGNPRANKQNPTNNVINKLPDDLLISILSRLSLEEAARTSVLERRWRSLWCFMFGTLQFVYKHPIPTPTEEDDDAGFRIYLDAFEKFEAWVSSVLELHQGGYIEGLVIRFHRVWSRNYHIVDSWVFSALQKEVERIEFHLSNQYRFPSLEMLISHSRSGSPFRCLRTLRLADLTVKDEVVNYFPASCPNLEQLCILRCSGTKNVLVVDPPSLRVLEVNRCEHLESMEVSAAGLVSLGYGGSRNVKSMLLGKFPDIRELTIVDDIFMSFFSEPEKYSSYIDQLVKLVVDIEYPSYMKPVAFPRDLLQLCGLKQLEVKVMTDVGRSFLFFTSVIKASPQLCKFRIEMSYRPYTFNAATRGIPFPAISGAEAAKFEHTRLKVVEMVGYIGCSTDEELLGALVKNAPLMERVVIDTQSEYYDSPDLIYVLELKRLDPGRRMETGGTTRSESQNNARRLVSTLPQQIEFIVT